MFRNHHSIIRAFINAFRGVKYALRERSFFIQLIINNAEAEREYVEEWATCDKDTKQNNKNCKENIVTAKNKFDLFLDNL